VPNYSAIGTIFFFIGVKVQEIGLVLLPGKSSKKMAGTGLIPGKDRVSLDRYLQY